MKNYLICMLIFYMGEVHAQMMNDYPFQSHVEHPAYKHGKGPKVLVDKAHHNFIVEMGLIKPLIDVLKSDGYQTTIDSSVFTPSYLARYDLVVITPAMPFTFGTKNEVTMEKTFSEDELVSLRDWVGEGGSLLVLSEHAPIDKSMDPLLRTFGIASSRGALEDPIHCDSTIKIPGVSTYIKFNRQNGLLNTAHPIIKGRNLQEQVNQLITYTGSSLSGEGYTNVLKLAPSATQKKWNGTMPDGLGNSQCLAGSVGKGRVVALGDCNGFTAMYVLNKAGEKLAAGMQVKTLDWKQFALNTFHWLSKH